MSGRVLVVDDIAPNRRLLEARLTAEYYEVALADSGCDALTLAASWAPDVILLDVMMPGMDGYEVCRRLKADPVTAHLPVVMVTALVDPTERVRGLEAGADDFLSKPVEDATLFARLRALLRVKQVQDAWRLQAATAQAMGFAAPAPPMDGTQGAHALVFADDPAEGSFIARALERDGIVPRILPDAAAASGLLETAEADVVVVCAGPKGRDALQLASRLRTRAATRDLPVLLVADAGQRGLVLRGFDLGVNDHVLRPIDAGELRARARNQIRRRRYQARLREDLDRSLELAVTDPLTGLRNRRYVRHHLDGVLRQGPAAVLMVDLDHFKAINDDHGHAAGDAALREVAGRLQAHLRAADVVARYGGEEFLVVLASAPPDFAHAVAERLRLALGTVPVGMGGAQRLVTASIGLAVAAQGSLAADVIAAADLALYRAKALGRDRVELARLADLSQARGPDTPPTSGWQPPAEARVELPT